MSGIVAAAFDVVRWERWDLDLAAFASAAAFLVALVASATLARRRPDRRLHQRRALVETAIGL